MTIVMNKCDNWILKKKNICTKLFVTNGVAQSMYGI